MAKRYYFHVTGTCANFPDPFGAIFHEPEEARIVGGRIAAELGQDGDYYANCVVHVVDEDGHEVVQVSVITG